MTISCQIYTVDTDTGTWTDTGPPFDGAVLQARWYPTTGDTGGDLTMYLDIDPNDTGAAIPVIVDNDILGAAFLRAPRQEAHDQSGVADTGSGELIYSAGEKLRVRVIPGGAAVAGKLWVWTG